MPQREIIRPEYNVPCVFQLGHAPSEVEGYNGKQQWRYFVNNDEALLFLDTPAKEAIEATGAGNGQQVALVKARQGRSNIWRAEIVPYEKAPGIVPATEVIYTEDQAHAKATQARQQARAQFVNGTHSNGNGSNGNGYHQPDPPPPAPPVQLDANRYAQALRAAIDVAKRAQDYAASIGMELKFNAGDVRAMAATLFIPGKEAK